MDLGFKRYQETLRRTARQYLARVCRLENLRAAEASEAGFLLEHYHEMAGLGWFGLALPAAEAGGADDFLNQLVLYEEYGRAALPGPHFVSTILGQQLVARVGSEAQRALLPAIAQGERILTLGLYEETADDAPGAVRLRATARGDDYRLDGRKLFVPFAHVADPLIVVARTGEAPAQLSLFLVSAASVGLSLRPLETIAGDKQFEVVCEGVEVPAAALLGPLHDGWEALEAVTPMATVLQAAELVGLADAALEIAVEYAKMRVAFGRAIGGFQAIQHKCADMLSDYEAARFLTYEAACLVNAGDGATPQVAMAKAFAATAARRVTKEAHQILAGVGFTLEHRLPYYYRRVKMIEQTLGSVDEQLRLVADRLVASH